MCLKYKICKRCFNPFTPLKTNQKYCSYWCEKLDKERIAENVSKPKVLWHKKFVNDRWDFGIDFWWAYSQIGFDRKFYKIVPFVKNGSYLGSPLENTKLFALYETSSFKEEPNSDEKYDGVVPINFEWVGMYKSFEDAKYSVKLQFE